jgi:AraC-like DNA-binding protein
MAANSHRDDVTAAEVAGVIGVSVNRLQAIFRKEVGRRPLQLLRDIALYRVHLALTGQAPAPASIAEAARLAGYTRVTRFRDAYRAYFGQNPSIPGRAAAAARDVTADKPPQPGPAAAEAGAAGTSARFPVHRKRALRQLAREQHAAYSALYEQVLSRVPGLTPQQARGRALTRLRHKFPGRYLELLAVERSGAGTEVPPGIRSKSWQRATARLADLRQAAYQARFAQFRAQGMAPAKAYDRAIAAVREGDADLFARLLAEEYQLWLAVSGGIAPAGDGGPVRGSEPAGSASVTAAPRRLTSAGMPGEGSDR